MPPAVVVELLSDPKLVSSDAGTLLELPMIKLEPGDGAKLGALCAKVLRRRCMARLGDVLIAQNCLDCGAHLITRNRGFLAFADPAELGLAIDH